ncbi:MAG: hypothetical protein SNJ52_04665 [Verrucomicrobiia bacterium]
MIEFWPVLSVILMTLRCILNLAPCRHSLASIPANLDLTLRGLLFKAFRDLQLAVVTLMGITWFAHSLCPIYHKVALKTLLALQTNQNLSPNAPAIHLLPTG